MPRNPKSLINFQDGDGSIKSALEDLVKQKRAKDQYSVVTLSEIIRQVVWAGIPVVRAQLNPRLEDKQKTGSLRKG